MWSQKEDRSRTDDLADLKGNIQGADKSNDNRRNVETANTKGEAIAPPKRKPDNVGGVFMMGGGMTRRA